MQIVVKFVALATVCSVAAYGAGRLIEPQASPVRKGSSQEPSQIANGSPFEMNDIQRVLHMHVCNEAEKLLNQTQYDSVRQKIILAQNYLVMTLLDPKQQKANLAFIQVDEYRPGPGPWDRVRKAPSKAKAILKVDGAQQAAFNAYLSEEHARKKAAIADLEGLPREEAQRIYAERMARKSRDEHRAEWDSNLKREQENMLKHLTAAQKAEWQMFMKLTDQEFLNAVTP